MTFVSTNNNTIPKKCSFLRIVPINGFIYYSSEVCVTTRDNVFILSVSVRAVTFECHDIETLALLYFLTISRSSLSTKVIGSKSLWYN